MDILEILKNDYRRFPANQTYSIYATDVYFKDPLTRFRGIARYQEMINFITTWFHDVKMEVHDISRFEDKIETKWTLYWTTPLPWKPRIAITGSSELTLNSEGKIISHIDYWDCSRWDVLRQHFWQVRDMKH